MQESNNNVQYKDILISNLDKIHTTKMGAERISKNLNIKNDPVEYCKRKIQKKESEIIKKGKNYYVDIDDCTITVNASSYTIITAHKKSIKTNKS